MHRSTRVLFAMFLLTLFLPLKIFAWNALGHMVITQIAYDNLQPDVKRKVNNLVGFFAKEYPNTPTLLQMAIWPDAIRSQKIDTFARWHYIDVPFSPDGSKLTNTISTDNAAWALSTIKNVVQNERANTYERARFLAFTIHIVGDLHQPLHTVTRITAAHPDGDRGGNLFYIGSRKASKMNLHRLWDGGVGVVAKEGNADNAEEIAQALMSRYPLTQLMDGANNMNVTDWEKEGMDNALTYVYNTKEGDPISTAYRNAGQRAAEKELALAGYRLANLLNTLLGQDN